MTNAFAGLRYEHPVLLEALAEAASRKLKEASSGKLKEASSGKLRQGPEGIENMTGVAAAMLALNFASLTGDRSPTCRKFLWELAESVGSSQLELDTPQVSKG